MTVRTIIDEISADLTDSGHDVWTEVDLLRYLNDAQRQVVFHRPDSYSTTQAVQLTAGITKQSLPIAANRLLNNGIKRNMGADGATPGRVITDTDLESMDLVDPDWHTRTGKAVIEHYIYDEADPSIFYVTPPAHLTTAVWVEMTYSSDPPELLIADIETDNISLDLTYEPVLKEWMLYRAYSKETDSNESRSLAASHFQVFGNLLGLKFKIDRMYSSSKEVKDAS